MRFVFHDIAPIPSDVIVSSIVGSQEIPCVTLLYNVSNCDVVNGAFLYMFRTRKESYADVLRNEFRGLNSGQRRIAEKIIIRKFLLYFLNVFRKALHNRTTSFIIVQPIAFLLFEIEQNQDFDQMKVSINLCMNEIEKQIEQRQKTDGAGITMRSIWGNG